MTCTVCKKTVLTLYSDGLPTYYVGPDPRSLVGATAIFCGADCSLQWYEEQKDEIQEDSKR